MESEAIKEEATEEPIVKEEEQPLAIKEVKTEAPAEGPSETSTAERANRGGKTSKGDKAVTKKSSRHVHFGSVSTHSIDDDQAFYVGRTGFRDLGSCTWSLCREFRTTPRWLENILIVSKINLVKKPPPPPKPVIKYPKLRMMED